MTKALVVPFIHYSGTSKETSNLLYLAFKIFYWKLKDKFDAFYIIDSGDFINDNLEKCVYIKKPFQSHWDNLNQVLPSIKEDWFLLIDSDTMVYRTDLIDQIDIDMETYDIVSIFDNSGGKDMFKYKEMRPNQNRQERKRFSPYFFACKSVLIKSLGNIDCSPVQGQDWMDSFGKLTCDLLDKIPHVKELPDDRTNVYLRDGEISISQWLDDGDWKMAINPNYGYYHIRNFGLALRMYDADDMELRKILKITPPDEVLRQTFWLRLVLELAGKRSIKPLSIAYQSLSSDQKSADNIENYYDYCRTVYGVIFNE